MNLRRKLAFFQQKKPEYTPLEYLQGTGRQYINLDYVPTENTGLYIKLSTAGNGDMIVCGIRESTQTNSRLYLSSTISGKLTIGRNSYLYIHTNGQFTSGSDIVIPYNTVYEQWTNYMNDRVVRFVDSTRDITSVRIPELTFTPTIPLYLFTGNIGSKVGYSHRGKIYRCKLTEGDKVVMDLIPALVNNEPCMYDLIEKKPYYNAGTGEFGYQQ